MKNPQTLWIIEDDPGARFVYSKTLDLKYELRFFETVLLFRNAFLQRENLPDLVIADLRLPDESFLTFLANQETSLTTLFPFIVVSSVDDIDILRMCFSEGAADYITKPFNSSELIVKIQRILETQNYIGSPRSPVEVDPAQRKISDQIGHSVQLTPRELQIFSVLRQAKNGHVTRTEIISKVWGNISVSPKALDVHLFSLRKKTELLGLQIQFVHPDSFMISSDRMNQ